VPRGPGSGSYTEVGTDVIGHSGDMPEHSHTTGVLFLDELTEFRRDAVEAVRAHGGPGSVPAFPPRGEGQGLLLSALALPTTADVGAG
jgi:Magnesium chelatase, subunit ChlI